jgi:hypothetical protein
VDRRTREEWHWQMQCRHLELMELEQSFRVLFEPDPTNVDAVPCTTLELTIEQPHVPPQIPGETIEQLYAVPNKTVELELSSPILLQHSESLLTEVSPAQSESELMDEEEACVVDDIGAHYGLPVLRVLATDRPPPKPGQELMDEEEACVVDDIDADYGPPEACAVDAIDGDYGFPLLGVLPTDRPPPNSGHPFDVRKDRASPKSTEELIDETQACVLEAVLGEYAFPTLLFVPTDRPPPKPGEAAKLFAYGSITTTWRTIKVKACRSGQERRKGGAAIRTRSRWYWRGRQSCKKGHVTVWDMAVRIREHVVVRTGKPYLYYLRETLHV